MIRREAGECNKEREGEVVTGNRWVILRINCVDGSW
jgi:hypothetical protein